MYDIIGDVHGHAERLESLLEKLGYQNTDGVWRHPHRKLISVGDLVDRGPYQRRSVDIIRAMHEAGEAFVIMGNHEFNAVAWATMDADGQPLRPHTKKNRAQHQAFLQEAEQAPEWYASSIEWFRRLPLYLDLPDLRVVHACWHEQSLAVLNRYLDSRGALLESAWKSATTPSHELFDAIETLCKGWETSLPDGTYFHDKDGHERRAIRTQWWRTDSQRYRDLAISVGDPSSLPNANIDSSALPGYDNQKPLFVGHYWMRGEPCLQSSHIACVDWTVTGQHGKLVAYRFHGEAELDANHFVWV